MNVERNGSSAYLLCLVFLVNLSGLGLAVRFSALSRALAQRFVRSADHSIIR